MDSLFKILNKDRKLSLILLYNTNTDRKWIGEITRSVADGVVTEAKAEGDSFNDVVETLVNLYTYSEGDLYA